MKRKSASSAQGKRARKNGASMKPSKRKRGIDFSDIPVLSKAQLKSMRRVGKS